MESSNARAKLTEELEADSGDAASSQLAKLTRLEKKIEIAERNVERMERVLNIQNSDRWPKSSAQYAAAREKKARQEIRITKAKLRSLIVGRTMMKDQLHREGRIGT